jgi:FMN-dependent NADH-azoreductase
MMAITHPDSAVLVAPLFAFGGKRGLKTYINQIPP